MDEGLKVSLEEAGGKPVLRAAGEVDVATAPKLRDSLAEIPQGTGVVIVDLSEVSFIDSSGLGVLVAAWKRFSDGHEGAELRLVVVRPGIERVLEVTGLASVFSIFPTLEDAVQG
jgi:anti-sigma B factor antagonist